MAAGRRAGAADLARFDHVFVASEGDGVALPRDGHAGDEVAVDRDPLSGVGDDGDGVVAGLGWDVLDVGGVFLVVRLADHDGDGVRAESEDEHGA